MKMRKIISFVLTLALVLGSFSMAFATTPVTGLSDIAGIDNEEAIQVNNDLGIITGMPDGTFLPEKAVNRAEFAAMITRALAIPESALAGYSATSFKDMSGYAWATGYVAFAQSKGIMLGDGNGNAMPGRTISVNEAMTMALRAIGYVSNAAELVGTWPANYVSVAQNVSLYEDVTSVANVDRANAAQIIYNLLTVQKVAVSSDGTTTYLTTGTGELEESVTLLSSGLECEFTTDVVEYTEDSLINLSKYIGAYADIYTNSDDEIVAVKMITGFLTGEYDADGTFEADNGIDYTVGEVTPASVAVKHFENAKLTGTVSLAAFATTDTVTIAVDVTGKTIKEILSISEWDVTDAVVAALGDIEDLDDQQFAGWNFVTDDNGDIDLNSFMLVGATSLDQIAEDDVVYIYADGTSMINDEITKIAVGTAVIEEQKITEQDGSDYTIGGSVYNLATNIGDYDVEAGFAVGDTISAQLDAYGDIFTLEVVDGTADMYGIKEAYLDDNFDDPKIRVFTGDAAEEIFYTDLITTDEAIVSNAAVNTLFSYGIDNDGLIDSVDFVTVTASAASLSSISVLQANGHSYAIASDIVVFTIDSLGDYDIVNIGDVEVGNDLDPDYGSVNFQMFVDVDGFVLAMLIDYDNGGAGNDGAYAVINSEIVAIDADDMPIQKLTGFIDGVEFTKYTDDDTTVDGISLAAIQLWDVTLDSAGIITDATTEPGFGSLTTTIAAMNADKTALQLGTTWKTVEANSTVYVAELVDGEYVYDLSSLSSLRDGYSVYLYDTDEDTDGYDTVVFIKEV